MPANRSRMPWNSDDLATLGDLAGDGIPIRSIAFRLQRSTASVQGMLKKTETKVLRGKTQALQVQLLPSAYAKLKEFAQARRLTVNTFCRVMLEVCSREPDWVDRLLDDMAPDRNEVEVECDRHDPTDDNAIGIGGDVAGTPRRITDDIATREQIQVEVEVGVGAGPPALTASALSQPQLIGVMH
jgi:hypothetical protein